MNMDLGLQDGEKIVIIVDGFSLYSTSKSLGFEVDYKSILRLFKEQAYVQSAHYIVAFSENEDYSPVKPLTDYLEFNGYSVTKKAIREFSDPQSGARQIKDSIMVEFTLAMIEAADLKVDHIVLFTHRADYAAAITSVQKKGVRVTVVSSLKGEGKVADELRRKADNFIEISDIAPYIQRVNKVPKPESNVTVVRKESRTVAYAGGSV